MRISLLGYGKVAKQIELHCKLQAIPIAQIYHRSAEKNNGYFKCFDNSKKIKISLINDNYADCNDTYTEYRTDRRRK